jgi:hypothetical protein
MEREARGFLIVSLSDAEPALARPARRGTEGEGRAEGSEVDGTEQSRRGTNSIFRLRYQIASYTGYIGNLAPSPKHETNTSTDGSAQGEPEYMCN